jgi:hypothetical protein
MIKKTVTECAGRRPWSVAAQQAEVAALGRRRNLSSSNKRPRPSFEQQGASVDGLWYTTTRNKPSSSSKSLDMGRYGLRRLDYSKIDPQTAIWTVPPHPPTKSMKERIVFPLTLVIVAAFGLWTYMNPEEDDMRDYWKRVETGQILLDDDDDADDDDDDDEED